MGCDIHLYCEAKKTIKGEKRWRCADRFRLNPCYDGTEDEGPEYFIDSIYGDRNYGLFEAIAGVRPYYGNDIIDEPRDLPDDVSDVIKKESDRWGIDGHSHSYLTAKELFDYKKEHNYIRYSGLISREQSEALDKGFMPTTWCQGCSDITYVRREWK